MGGKTSAEAFRAFAVQLIDIHRNEDMFMDARLILFDKELGVNNRLLPTKLMLCQGSLCNNGRLSV